jgi:hypothetical protein
MIARAGRTMSTLIVVGILIVIGFSGQWLWLTVLNLAGIPGALVGGRGGQVRGIFGIILAVLGQSYVYLGFVAVVVIWTKYYIHQKDLVEVFVWPASFFACVYPIYFCAAAAEGERSRRRGSNVKRVAVTTSQFIVALGFFVFVFVPSVILVWWPWISWLSPKSVI